MIITRNYCAVWYDQVVPGIILFHCMELHMDLAEVHARLGNTALYYFLALAAWGLWRFFRKQGPDSNYWGALIIAEVLILIQGLLGAYMWLVGRRPAEGIHLLYGAVSLLVIPGVYAYTRGGEGRRVILVYGAALLFAVGITLRAITTGYGG
jgi:hypothetical protein